MITTRQALAAKKLVGAKLRKAALPDDLAKLDVDAFDKRGAHDAKNAIIKIAREVIDSMKDDADEIRVAEFEQAHDGLMAAFDAIEARLDVLNGTSNRPTYPDVSVRGDGRAIETGDEPTEAFALRRGQTFVDHVRSRNYGVADEFAGLSTGAYLRAMVLGPKTEAEKRALAEGTDSAGGYSVPDILSARMIDRMRAASVVFRAGAQTVPLGSDVNFAGDWAKLLVGIRSEIRIDILKERYADVHQFGFVAHMRADVAAEHEAAFTVLDGITG